MEQRKLKKISISVTQRQLDGTMLGVEIDGTIKTQVGSNGQVGNILLEAEQHGNSGNCRIHMFLKG